MAAPPVHTGWHPFHSRERVNFPDFSPIFSRHVTPEAQRGFHWSIDHMARLKPADIDTDPCMLVKTNGDSPESDGETQQASERFFSQHSILPSPWPTAHQRSNVRQALAPRTIPHSSLTPGHTKKVTFSPHPPSLAYISSESLESELKETALADAATQTTLTIPLSYNLNTLLGPAFVYSGGDGTVSGGVRDLANMSLRRKLFGQPIEEGDDEDERMREEDGEDERGREGDDREGDQREGDHEHHSTVTVTPLKCTPRGRHLSSTPLKPHHHHQQHTSHYTPSPSPHIFPTGVKGGRTTHPTTSSFVLPPGENLPECSPIEEGGVVSGTRSKETSEACKKLFSLTPNKQSMYSTHLTPSPLPMVTCPLFSPILCHHPCDDVRRECDDVKGASGDYMTGKPTTPSSALTVTRGSSANKATSTPYCHGLGRQQVTVSSSPSAVQPLEDSPQFESERGMEAVSLPEGEGGRGEGMVAVGERDGEEIERNCSESSEDLPQPLTMADLQTSEDDLTSVTGVTTCTSYFTQLVTDDSHTLAERQPLHSTVAVPPNSTLNPLIVSTDPHQGAARLRLPSIREISRINAPSMNNTDSGVAASSDFNQHTGGHLTTSQGAGIGGLNSMNHSSPNEGMEREQMKMYMKKNALSREYYCPKSHVVKEEVDSGLAVSPDPATRSTEEEEQVQEMGGVTMQGQPLGTDPSDGGIPTTPQPSCRKRNITPSRYSTIQLYRNRMGVPLAITQKSIFTSNRTVLRSSHILPSQFKLGPSLPSPGVTLSHEVTPARRGGCSNWFGESRTSCLTDSRTSSIFPEAVLRKKETLKAQLNFCSPVRSRSPLSASSCRKPLADTLNLQTPAATLPFATLPSSHPPSSPLFPSPHLLATLPLSPMSQRMHTFPWQHP